MNDNETCVCDEHGVQPTTFVCRHIAEAARDETVGFVSGPAEDAYDLRDAWCGACHSFLEAHGGEWRYGSVEVPGGITIICAECYRRREADAERVSRRVIHQRA